MKKLNLILALAAVGLSGCAQQYDMENPRNLEDFVAFTVDSMGRGFGPSEKQFEKYWQCAAPSIPGLAKSLNSEQIAKVEEAIKVLKEDPEANRPDLVMAMTLDDLQLLLDAQGLDSKILPASFKNTQQELKLSKRDRIFA